MKDLKELEKIAQRAPSRYGHVSHFENDDQPPLTQGENEAHEEFVRTFTPWVILQLIQTSLRCQEVLAHPNSICGTCPIDMLREK